MTNEEFWDKMDWEGGYERLYDYGGRAFGDELEDSKMKELWYQFCDLMEKAEPIKRKMDALIGE